MEDLSIDEVLCEKGSEKQCGRVCTGFMLLIIGTNGRVWTSFVRSAEETGSRCVTAKVSAFYAVFCRCFTPMY